MKKYDLTLQERISLLCGQTFWKSPGLFREGIAPITYTDGPSGLRIQENQSDALGLHASIPSICYPVPASLANSWNPDLFLRVGRQMGIHAKSKGVDVVLAPCLNVKRNPLGGRNFEYISSSPYLCQILGIAMIEGLEESVFSCPKHFLLNTQETYRTSVDEQVSESSLYQEYLKPFLACAPLVNFTMSAYNRVNGVYCHENQYLDGLYRDAGFRGMIVSDWGGSNLLNHSQFSLHLEMPSTNGESIAFMESLAERDQDFQKLLMERSNEYLEVLEKVEQKRVRKAKEDQDRALEISAALQSMVLLKNEGVLPIDKNRKHLLWIGDFDSMPFQGGGSSHVNTRFTTTFRDLLRASFSEKQEWVREYDDLKIIQKAKEADLCIMLAYLQEKNYTEGVDRMDKELPLEQRLILSRLEKLGIPVILIYAGPAGLKLDVSSLKAFVYAALAGEGALNALMTLLTGSENFSAALAEPFYLQDHPKLQIQKKLHVKEHENLEFSDFFLHYPREGYYPFGYGLSYTSFRVQELVLKEDKVLVRVTNTGNREGDWIGQLYLQQPERSILCAFEKQKIPAGKTREVLLKIDPQIFYEFKENEGWFERKEGTLFLGSDERSPLIYIPLQDLQRVNPLFLSYRKDTFPKESLATENFPLELYCNSARPAFSWLTGFLARLRDLSLKTDHPNWALVSILNNSPRALNKLNAPLFSKRFVDFCKRSFIQNLKTD